MSGKHKVLLPQPIEKEAHDYLLENNCEVVVCSKCEHSEVAEKIADAEAVVLRTGIKITRDLIEKGKKLKTISRTGAGVDNVDLEAATEAGIVVTSSLGANTTSVIEHALMFILSLSKNIIKIDSEVRKGNFKVRYQSLSSDVRDKTLGLVGFGRIGSGLARICRDSFAMNIIANDDFLPPQAKDSFSDWVRFTDLDTLIEKSDYISIHVPLTKETKDLFDFSKMKKMKKTAFLINTSRGGIINEKDLVKALEEKIMAGAGLDVFENEPIEMESGLLKLDNVILSPHTAALTVECTLRMAMEGVKRVVRFFNGEEMENVANPAVLVL
ncbi:MAG: hydroxyacid dehydrogenase [Spirochaetia bacterium]|jgi:D-3-phosphoglycerate dehydrogenase|nr:hydroxyacid dehydrogenase [Spirochaetia bacterium]